jgi:hypothetical protein
MAIADVTTLVVAAVGVAGTMGAPWLSARSQRADARDQEDRERGAREDKRRNREFENRRKFYAALNRSARSYRSAIRNYAWAVWRGDHTEDDLGEVQRAREIYKEHYSEAQMVLPQPTLEVAEAVNSWLGHGYKLIRSLKDCADPQGEVDEVLTWLRGPLKATVAVLRQALREDLGAVETTIDHRERLASLDLSTLPQPAERVRM